MGKVNIKPVGDRAVLLEFGDQINEEINRMVMQAAGRIGRAGIAGLQEMVPAFASLLICYDPLATDYRKLAEQIDPLVSGITAGTVQTGRLVEIPVCYGGIYGEDLAFVARHAGLSEEEVIRIHSGRDYRIYMLGFLPGFPYLGGLDERIFTPRLSNPRTKIPAGSVGIGGEQTGIYPMESPGGWQLIGRTPLKLFDPEQGGKRLYEAGDTIRFVPVSPAEYENISLEQEKR